MEKFNRLPFSLPAFLLAPWPVPLTWSALLSFGGSEGLGSHGVSGAVALGTGSANYAGLFAAIKQSGWSGVMAIETDRRTFQADPNQLVAEGAKFFAANHGTGAK